MSCNLLLVDHFNHEAFISRNLLKEKFEGVKNDCIICSSCVQKQYTIQNYPDLLQYQFRFLS